MYYKYKPRQRSAIVQAYSIVSIPAFVVLAMVAMEAAAALAIFSAAIFLWGRIES